MCPDGKHRVEWRAFVTIETIDREERARVGLLRRGAFRCTSEAGVNAVTDDEPLVWRSPVSPNTRPNIESRSRPVLLSL